MFSYLSTTELGFHALTNPATTPVSGLAHRCLAFFPVLARLTAAQLESSASKPDQKLVTLTKCMHYVLKFIVASREKDQESKSPSCDQVTPRCVALFRNWWCELWLSGC